MNNRDDEKNHELRGDMAKLRDALRAARVPVSEEARLRVAFRAHHAGACEKTAAHASATAAATAAQPQPSRGTLLARSPGARRFWTLTATGALAASAAIAVLVLDRFDERALAVGVGSPDRAPVAVASASDPATSVVFQPLLYAPSLAPSESYSVVRVRLPLASLGYGFEAPPGSMIEADILIGEDGLARGIRFDTTDTLVAAVSSQ